MKKMIDLSLAKREYYGEEVDLYSCPECGYELVKENCTIMLTVKSETDEGQFMTNHLGSHFCSQCPVVVFDNKQVEKAAKIGIGANYNLKYHIAGIVNLKAVPKEKQDLELGTDDNPIPVVPFLPALRKNIITAKKIGRNDACTCGSGRKYKKCCGNN